MRTKTIRDAVHGDLLLDPLAVEIIDTPVFQRLRGIKQLGTASLVFPTATHTRFEHSLGTYWLTRRIAGLLKISDDRLVSLAALLHDITHIPFGHTFEDERRLWARHDEETDRLTYFLDQPRLRQILEREGLRIPLGTFLGGDQPPTFESDIVRGTLSADLLDYLKRDAWACGLRLDYDERVLHYLTISQNRLAFDLCHRGRFRPDALSELVHLLRTRYTLTERVYHHHGKVVSGAMLSRAVEFALDTNRLRREELYLMRDDAFLHLLRERLRDHEEGITLLDELESHCFYRCVYELKREDLGGPGIDDATQRTLEHQFHLNPNGIRRETEESIARQLGVRPGEVLIHCPSGQMQFKEADVPVLLEDQSLVLLSSTRLPEVEILRQKYRQLWRFRVYLRRCRDAIRPRAIEVCQATFGSRNHGVAD